MSRPPFKCKRCNKCCQGQGGIYLQKDQIPAAAKLMDMSADEFIGTYCVEKKGRYEIICDENGACILQGPDGCRIHQAKPDICELWPFFPGILKDAGAFEEAKLICPGIDPEASHAEFVSYYHQNVAPSLKNAG